MNTGRLKSVLPKFVQHVQCHGGKEVGLTVKDLQNAIRQVRMSEISDWCGHELDLVEVHASRFEGELPMESLLNSSLEIADRESAAISVSSICSPSPFAWM